MDIGILVNMSSRAWMLPILAQMHLGVAGRQAALIGATGAGRSAFATSIAGLIQIGLVERNPGHGHPLRPEFRLTPQGCEAAALAAQVQQAAADDAALLRRAWTLPVLSALHGASGFNQVKRSVPRITDRALSMSLKTLEDRDWIARSVLPHSRPPRPVYRPVGVGAEVSALAGAALR